VAISACKRQEIAVPLKRIQAKLFTAGADLATDLEVETGGRIPRIGKADTDDLERMIDALQAILPPLKSFILPGGSQLSAALHLARAVCRRAERRVVALSREEKINPDMIPFLNRLSTYLFNLARQANMLEGKPEEPWNST
jgi:cob(I)alamin adenosyltransferase